MSDRDARKAEQEALQGGDEELEAMAVELSRRYPLEALRRAAEIAGLDWEGQVRREQALATSVEALERELRSTRHSLREVCDAVNRLAPHSALLEAQGVDDGFAGPDVLLDLTPPIQPQRFAGIQSPILAKRSTATLHRLHAWAESRPDSLRVVGVHVRLIGPDGEVGYAIDTEAARLRSPFVQREVAQQIVRAIQAHFAKEGPAP